MAAAFGFVPGLVFAGALGLSDQVVVENEVLALHVGMCGAVWRKIDPMGRD